MYVYIYIRSIVQLSLRLETQDRGSLKLKRIFHPAFLFLVISWDVALKLIAFRAACTSLSSILSTSRTSSGLN